MPHIAAPLSSARGVSLAAETHQMEGAAAEQAAALPHVAQRVCARGSPVLAHFDVSRVNTDRNAEGPVLRVLFVALERGLDVPGIELAVASDRNRRSAG